jgi:inosine/xanthosine triphosphate pyrophosphatase family protein
MERNRGTETQNNEKQEEITKILENKQETIQTLKDFQHYYESIKESQMEYINMLCKDIEVESEKIETLESEINLQIQILEKISEPKESQTDDSE